MSRVIRAMMLAIVVVLVTTSNSYSGWMEDGAWPNTILIGDTEQHDFTNLRDALIHLETKIPTTAFLLSVDTHWGYSFDDGVLITGEDVFKYYVVVNSEPLGINTMKGGKLYYITYQDGKGKNRLGTKWGLKDDKNVEHISLIREVLTKLR